MSVFILADLFHETAVLYIMSSVFLQKFDEVIFLKENHRSLEDIVWQLPYLSFRIYNSIEDCIKNCDSLLIVESDIIPHKTIEYAKKLSEHYHKQSFSIDICNTVNNMNDSIFNSNIIKQCDFDNMPVILIISMGKYTMPYCLDTCIGKALSESNVHFKQIFFDTTKRILLQLYEQKQLNSMFINSLEDDLLDKRYDVLTISVDAGSDLENLRDYPIEKLQPDFIVLLTENNFCDANYLRNYIEYNYHRTLDMIIKSPFAMIDYYMVSFTNDHILERDVYYLTDPQLEGELVKRILAKISYPKGVSRI